MIASDFKLVPLPILERCEDAVLRRLDSLPTVARKDLLRDPRYTMHCAVEDYEGGGGEFYVRGRATLTDDPAVRAQAVEAASYEPRERYLLFVLTVDFAFMNTYSDEGSNPKRWEASS